MEDEHSDLIVTIRDAVTEELAAFREGERSVMTVKRAWRAYVSVGGTLDFPAFRYQTQAKGFSAPNSTDDPEESAVGMIFEILVNTRKPFGGRHGLKCAIETNCKCTECSSAMNRYQFIRQHCMVEENTLESAAQHLGITRERARQIMKMVHPSWSVTTQRVVSREREEAKERRRNRKYCPICNQLFWAGKAKKFRRTCGGECQKIYRLLLRDLNEKRREAQRVASAKWWIANRDREDDPLRWDHCQRMVKINGDSSKIEDRKGWFVEGSATFDAACRLYELGGRAFENLRPAKQKQVRDYMQAREGEDE